MRAPAAALAARREGTYLGLVTGAEALTVAGRTGAETRTGHGSGARRFVEILLYKTYCELRLESERYWVGLLWWTVEPVLEMAVYYVVFAYFLPTGVDRFVAFLLCGLVTWRWLAQSLQRGAVAIRENQPLSLHVTVPKALFPLVVVAAETLKFVVVLALLGAFVVAEGSTPNAAWLAIPVVFAAQLLLIVAVTLWAAAVVPFAHSALVAVGVALRFGVLVSGVFYDVEKLSTAARTLLSLNPMVAMLAAWRDVLMFSRAPDWPALGWIAALSSVAIAGAVAFLRRNELVYPKLPA